METIKTYGRWIVNDDGFVVCSECGGELPYVIEQRSRFGEVYPKYTYIEKTRYCPDCGVKMEEEE